VGNLQVRWSGKRGCANAHIHVSEPATPFWRPCFVVQTTIPLAGKNLSTPGCWVSCSKRLSTPAHRHSPPPPPQAYPDMLEVGVQFGNGGLSFTESRSHFNAW
jgi:hypothetical protein